MDDSDDALISEEKAVIGFWSAFIWLAGMTVVISLLSEYIVDTIEVSIYIKTFIIFLVNLDNWIAEQTVQMVHSTHPDSLSSRKTGHKPFILNGNYCLLK